MKRLLSATVAGLIATFAFGQQEIQLTQFMNNKLYFNPGVAGSSGSICLNAVHRTQWQGFENAPSTQNINAEIPIAAILGAISVNITNDKIGYFQDIKFGLGYAYQMNLANGTLGLGLSLDFINKGLSGGEWIPPDQGASDPSLGKFGASSMTPELNFGAYYQSSTFYAGVSSREMLSAKAELDNNFGSVTGVKLERTYFIMGGYNWNIPNTPIVVTPALMAKTDLSGPMQLDINASALYNNKIWGGVTYRLQDAVAIMAGYYIMPDLRVSYSYDITTSALRSASSGSHEIMLNYCFKIEIPPREKGYYRNPRFL